MSKSNLMSDACSLKHVDTVISYHKKTFAIVYCLSHNEEESSINLCTPAGDKEAP